MGDFLIGLAVIGAVSGLELGDQTAVELKGNPELVKTTRVEELAENTRVEKYWVSQKELKLAACEVEVVEVSKEVSCARERDL